VSHAFNAASSLAGSGTDRRLHFRLAVVFHNILRRACPAVVVLVGVGVSLSATEPAVASARGRYVELSNETTRSYWAYERHAGVVFSRPRTSSRAITRLRAYTELGFPEVYLLLRRYTDTRGRIWIEIRIPRRPNGEVGWVLRGALSRFHLTRWQLVLDENKLRLSAYFRGHLRFQAPVAIGKPSTPTPVGHFWVREVFKIRQRSSGFWPYALGTSDYSTLPEWPDGGVVGIHGPYHEPQLIPGRISHGCIRLETRADAWIGHHIGVGTPLLIR
jgi:hypothetical protein